MTIDIVAQRLKNQQLIEPHFATPAELVRWFGAVQAQDLPASLWAIGLRLNKILAETDVEQAIADKSLIRSWPMRGTIHLVPAEDAKWMLKLLAPRLDAKVASNYRRAGITGEEVRRAGEVLTHTLRGGGQCTRAELYTALNQAKIATNGQNGEQRGMHLLVHWARHGLICITPRRGKQQTFALLDEWFPGGRDLDGDEALAELARRYFRSHGPATVKDFAWWAGLAITEARKGIDQIKKEYKSSLIEKNEYWMMAESGGSSHQSKSPAHLLPPYDEYTVAYADRSAVISRQQLAGAGYGIAPNLIIDGTVAGTWKRTLHKNKVTITLDLLRQLTHDQKRLVNQAAERYAKFLALESKLQISE